MLLLRYLTLKTQVRRLKYFSVALSFLSKNGMQKQIFSALLINWSTENHAHLKQYKSSSGEINLLVGQTISNSFNSYFKALLQLELIIEQGNFIIPTKTADVFNLLKEFISIGNYDKSINIYNLNSVERIYFLAVLFERDYDILILVLKSVQQNPSKKLEFHLKNFKNEYLNRLENKLRNPKIENPSDIIQAIQRINAWRNSEKYSEEYVPQRINWLLDLGFFEEYNWNKGNIVLNSKGEIFSNTIQLKSVQENEFSTFDDEWYYNSFVSTMAIFCFDNDQLNLWGNQNELRKQEILEECFSIAVKRFAVLGISRLPAKSTLLFCSLYILLKYFIVIDFKSIIDWVGFERKVSNKYYKYRGAEREGESYFIINYD